MTHKNLASLDMNYLLIENYKKLKITEEELVVVLMVRHLLEEGNTFITGNLLSLKMNYDENTLDDILVSLLKKGYLEYVESSDGGLRSSIEPLLKILYKEFERSVIGSEINTDREAKANIVSLYKKFEKTFGRSLAPIELHRIDEWIGSFGYTIDQIEFALKEAKVQNVLNIKYIDKILNNSKKREDIKKEGYTFRGEDSQIEGDVDDVIEILKTKWTK